VESAGGYAMEGPGTAWIPRGIDRARLPYLLAHETAHQWLPGLVGNDQWAQPWADEGVVDMIARTTLNERRAPRCAQGRLDLDITRYTGACYYEVVYIQGGNWLNDLRRRMGDDAFWGAIRSYLAEHRFGLGSTRAFLDTLDAATPLDIRKLAEPLFPSVY
jgi:aminopeptidase N